MKLYRYLKELEHANAYINGGNIPLFPARSYLAEERTGIFTPDEVLQQSLTNAPIEAINALGKISGDARVRMFGATITVGDYTFKDVNYYRGTEDSLVLCFATKMDKSLAEKLGKTVCVEISEIDFLVNEISKQLGVQGESGHCTYTNSVDRNHFLKSTQDSWQEEYRIVWRGIKEQTIVKIPSGIGKDVTSLL